ncbi:protein phosphatase 2A, regulatory B subunit, B56 [Kipferlia bialata]|uniref:Protein phosphatase 2A, regulatory B subunit, B56 n=1 Tax=Kipferlia bialata TaxID=797122 RepID=A0A9K3GP61_9EUKA|nr:protein phosphatase 2A, regulatory B subunit, B56 [Kipferlia bialata]|eukprot:g12066.t1
MSSSERRKSGSSSGSGRSSSKDRDKSSSRSSSSRSSSGWLSRGETSGSRSSSGRSARSSGESPFPSSSGTRTSSRRHHGSSKESTPGKERKSKRGGSHSKKASSSDASEGRDVNADIAKIPRKISLRASLPSFREVAECSRVPLFISKLRQCCKILKPSSDPETQELMKLKQDVLSELLTFIESSGSKFPADGLNDFIRMVTVNLFRNRSKPHTHTPVYDADDDTDSVMEPLWAQLRFVYELLLRFVSTPSIDDKTFAALLPERYRV